MLETQRFDLRTILSVTTGRLLTESEGPKDNGIGRMYKLLGWMTDDQPFTHQLGRFAEECKPWLLRWFPELANAEKFLGYESAPAPRHETPVMAIYGLHHYLDAAKECGKPVEPFIKNWASLMVADHGMQQFYDVPRIPADDHTAKDAYDELVEMRGTDEGIEIITLDTTQTESDTDAN